MQHNLRLHHEPFIAIKSGKKRSEIRLYDEKRQQMRAGDTIIFTSRETNEQITTQITQLVKYQDFEDLFSRINLLNVYPLDKMPLHEIISYMRTFYSKEDELKYGVIDIQLKLIK